MTVVLLKKNLKKGQPFKLIWLKYNIFLFTEVDVNRLARSRALEYVDLSDNPIPAMIHEELKQLTRPSVSVSEREKEDWEEDILL